MKKSVVWLCLVPCVLSFITTIVCLTLFLLPIFRYADLINDFKFKRVDDGYAIVEYVGDSKNITVPSSYKGRAVVEISDGVFSDSEKLYKVESISLPGNIKRIGNNAFCGLTGIENVNIPENCILIGDYAFFGCENLKSVHFGERLLNVGASAFSWTSLQALFLDGDEDFLIVDGVALFAKASSGDYVLPSDIRVLSHDACSALARSGIETFAVEQNSKLVSISCRGFAGSDILSVDLSLAKNLRYVGEKCFNDCKALESVVFSDNLSFVGEKAFYGCDALESVSFGKSVVDFSHQIFDNFSCVKKLEISAACGNFDVALGTEKFFISDEIFVHFSAGKVKDNFAQIFVSCANKLELDALATIDWEVLCKFGNLSEAVLPASVLNNCGQNLFVCSDVVRVFGSGTDVVLNCSPNIDTTRLEILNISKIESNAFSGQDLGFIDEIEVLGDSLNFVGGNVFTKTNWFVRNEAESVVLGDFCIYCADRNADGIVDIGEGVVAVCSGALSGSAVSKVVLPSSLVVLENDAFKSHVGTIVFRCDKNGNVLLERIGSGALYFGFDSVVVQVKTGEEWQNSESSLVLGNVCYVGKNAFDKSSSFFESQIDDMICFGATILVDIRANFNNAVLQVPNGIRIVASNCFDCTANSPVKLVFGDDVIMIGENDFGSKVREASFGAGLETVEGNGLFKFDLNYVGKLFIFSENSIILDLVVKTTNKSSVVLTTTSEMVDFYGRFFESYELKIIGE